VGDNGKNSGVNGKNGGKNGKNGDDKEGIRHLITKLKSAPGADNPRYAVRR